MVDWMNPSEDALAGLAAGRAEKQAEIEALEQQISALQHFLDCRAGNLLSELEELLVHRAGSLREDGERFIREVRKELGR